MYQFVKVIFGVYLVFAFETALFTSLDNWPLSPIFFRLHGLHHPPAPRGSITRIKVDVLAPKTLGAMIGISITFHLCPAILATKIFYFSYESHDVAFYPRRCKWAAIPIASPIIAKFLMIYWPSRVGTQAFCQVTSGNSTRGKKVVTICIASRNIATRSNLGNRKHTAINISNIPKNIMNWSKVMKGNVLSNKSATKELAGLCPSTLSSPNQKKITNTASLAKGTLVLRKNEIIQESILSKRALITL